MSQKSAELLTSEYMERTFTVCLLTLRKAPHPWLSVLETVTFTKHPLGMNSRFPFKEKQVSHATGSYYNCPGKNILP